MAKEKFLKDNAKAYEWLRKARQSCIEYITRVVKEHDNCITFVFDYDDENFCIMYDGGNHPEYASNCFSLVYSVFINKDGYLCVNIEDSSDYNIDRVNTDDVMTIAEALYNSAVPRLSDPEFLAERDYYLRKK